MITQEKARELAEGFFETSKKILQGGKELMPVAFVILPDGHQGQPRVDIMGLAFYDNAEKYAACEKVRAHAKKNGAEALVLITDNFYRSSANEADYNDYMKNKYPKGGLKDDPEAKEALGMVIMGPQLKTETRQQPYVRKPDKTIEFQEDEHFSTWGDAEIFLIEPWWPIAHA